MVIMSRRSKPQYVNHPLKLLRGITALSQPELAQVTGISLDVIRSLEIGRRNQGQLSEELLEQIFMSIGASWVEDKEQWMFLLTPIGTEPVPYTREHFQTFRQELLSEAHERELAIYYLLHEFLSFCEAIPAEAFNGWFWKLAYLLDQWREEVPWPATGYQLDPQWDAKSARVLGYRKRFPTLLKGEELKFGTLIKRAREQAGRAGVHIPDQNKRDPDQPVSQRRKKAKAPRLISTRALDI